MSVSPLLIAKRIDKARVKLAGRTAFLTLGEAADELGVDVTTLFNWRKRGLIDWQGKPANRYRAPTACVDPKALRALLGMSEAAP